LYFSCKYKVRAVHLKCANMIDIYLLQALHQFAKKGLGLQCLLIHTYIHTASYLHTHSYPTY